MPRKPKPQAKAATPMAEVQINERAYSASELAGIMFEAIPELQESMSQADAILALEDRGWISSTASFLTGDLSAEWRAMTVRQSRAYWQRDPLSKQAVRLWTDYAVGTGVTFQATDQSEKTNQGIQDQLNKFWKDRKNKRLTSSRGQQKLSKKLLVDGELFFAIFTEGEVPVIRVIDCLQVTNIISDPQDEEEVLCYKREYKEGATLKTLYYRDWAADADDLESLKDPDNGKAVNLEENVVVYHLPFDDIGKRGNGLLFSVIDWTREHRRFMQARVALTQALAKFAHKLTAKGGQKVIDDISRRLRSSVAGQGLNGLPERNPAPAPGSDWIQNAGIDLQPMPRATGAGDARQDGDGLKLMHCAGTGTMLHYYGDPSTGNLATAEAMELPMLKSFTGLQELWKDAWRDIFSIVLQEDPTKEPAAINVHLPPMLKDDLNKLGTFLMGLHQVFPEIQVDSILEMCLVALGCPNVDETMEEISQAREDMLQQQQNALTAATSPLGNQLPQPSIKVSKFTAEPANKPPPVRTAPVKEAVSLGEVLQSFAQQIEDVRQEIIETRKRSEQDRDREHKEQERALELAKLEWQESQSAAALNRLCQAIDKEPSPLLSESTIQRLLEGATPKIAKIEKTGEISRDPATGKMRFVMQETPIEEPNT